jgi:uncharacterized glyoxalase superfamily protein PhnB
MPYLVVHDAARAIDFYRNLFGAVSTHLRDVPPEEMAAAAAKFCEKS